MGSKTKIDWCDATWNPVTGCLHGCEYCYARKIAERFGSGLTPLFTNYPVLDKPVYYIDAYGYTLDAGISGGKIQPYPFDFTPTFHRYKLGEPARWKKPRNIFVCSMADLFGDWVPDEWIADVFDACEAAPQHRYLFLTKNPKRLTRMAYAYKVYRWNEKHMGTPHPDTLKVGNVELPVHDNWWFGSTIDNADARRFNGNFRWNTFTSIEPLMEHMHMGIGSFGMDQWTIIGAETGKRKNKVIPCREWVENIVQAADLTGVKIFMKESLRDLMGDDFRQEFPWEAAE
jgi:protein gp37